MQNRREMDTNWAPATPARARADARIVAEKISTKAFEDTRVKDHRDVERDRGVYLPPSAKEAATHADSTQPRLLSEDGKLEKFKYFDSEVDLGLEFGAGVSGYFFRAARVRVLVLRGVCVEFARDVRQLHEHVFTRRITKRSRRSRRHRRLTRSVDARHRRFTRGSSIGTGRIR